MSRHLPSLMKNVMLSCYPGKLPHRLNSGTWRSPLTCKIVYHKEWASGASLIHSRYYCCAFIFSFCWHSRSSTFQFFFMKQVWASWECWLQRSAFCLLSPQRLSPRTKTSEENMNKSIVLISSSRWWANQQHITLQKVWVGFIFVGLCFF